MTLEHLLTEIKKPFGYGKRLAVSAVMGISLLVGGCDGKSEEFARQEEMESPVNPCSDTQCGNNAQCYVNEDEEAECLCDEGFGMIGKECVPDKPQSIDSLPQGCNEYRPVCTSTYTMQICVSPEEGKCLGAQLVDAFCPDLYSECREGGECRTFPEFGQYDVCPTGRTTKYCRIADRYDFVEDGNKDFRELQFGAELNGDLNVPISCPDDQGIAIGVGPGQSYSYITFNLRWCAPVGKTVEYTLRARMQFSPGESGRYEGSPARIISSNGETYQIMPTERPCELETIAQLRYVGGSPLQLTFEGPSDSYLVLSSLELLLCSCE